jgi:hypothetical protein
MAPTDEDKLSNPPQADSRGADVDYFIRIPASKSAEGIRAQDIAVAIFQYRFLIGILAAVGLVLGGLVVFLAEPVYRAEVLLVTVEDEPGAGLGDLAGQLGGLAQIAGIDLDGKSNVWVPISMLKSRAFSEQFIEDNNLMPIIFSDEWDAEENAWSEKVKDDPPSLWDAYKVFDEDIRGIDWNSTTQLVVLSIKWRDPEVAAVWANDLIKRINERLRQQVIDEANKSIGYLKNELEKTNVVGLQQAIYRLVELQIEKIMLANVREEYAFKIIDPAVSADRDDYIWPNAPLILIVGLLGGFVIGFSIALGRYVWNREAL